MASKKNWHKLWLTLPNGSRLHQSGLELENQNGVWICKPESIDAFEQYETARGVPQHDLRNRLFRLTKECMELSDD